MESANTERTVLVTGFGPFSCHEINASWEAAKELYKLRESLRERHNVNLVIDHVPVVYDYVFEKIPSLWKEFNPELVLHVGVSNKAKCMTIEHRAHGTNYFGKDINNKCPTNVCEAVPPVLETEIDIKKLCRKINDNNSDNKCEACISHDAGRYLCEYIYYQSLCIDPKRVLFVHVPDLDVYPSDVTAKGLYDIIECILAG